MTLTDEGRRLVDAARAAYAPTDSDRTRVQAGLDARVAALMAAAAASSAKPAVGALSTLAGSKGAVVGLVAVVAIGTASVGYWGSRRSSTTTPQPASQSAAAPSAVIRDLPGEPRAPTASNEPRQSPLARSEAPAAPRVHRAASRAARQAAATPEPSPDLAGEVALLARAQKALADGDLQRCLQLLDQHERAFPHGVLTEERAAAHIIALCKLGQVETARAEIAAFLSKAPSSPFAERVKHACAAAWPRPVPPGR